MRVPLSWLREFVDVDLAADELAHRLTMAGTEAEDVVQVGADWESIVVARVVGLERHPNADNLYVARLDVGPRGPTTVVTGATNLSVGVRVPLVEPGGRLPDGRRIGAEELRGVWSEGMLCSGDELRISPDRSGIYILDEGGLDEGGLDEGGPDGGGPPSRNGGAGNGELVVGRPLAEALGDTVLDLYITPNRPDCMSVFGVAREVHAITGAPLRRPRTAPPTGDRPASELVRVEILDPDLCRRFTAGYVAGVTVGPSPAWLQRRLFLAGVRPISNVVDATNYTMLEFGHPQHAFDADRLGDQIVVRRAVAGERLLTLDGVDRPLTHEMLVIADPLNPVGIAGVMGGAATEVGPQTRNVILETATFAPSTVRKTSRGLRLVSEASRRFERGLDPELAHVAAERTIALLAEVSGGTPAAGIVDAYPGRAEPLQILVHENQIADVLGRPYSRAQVEGVLRSLDFGVEPQGERMRVTVPGHRGDVEGRADLAEEVARITGYDAIPEAMPTGAPPEPTVDPRRALGDQAKDILVGCGLQEVMTYSLVGPGSVERLLGTGESATGDATPDGADAALGTGDRVGWAPARPIEVANAISAEQSALRTTLLPSLIETARANLRHRDGVAIFELARVYLPPLAPLPTERTRLGIVLIGHIPGAWNAPTRPVDFFDLKGAVEELLGQLGVRWGVVAATSAGFHPGRCAALAVVGADGASRSAGLLGQLHPRAAERFDLAGREVYAAELELDVLAQAARGQPEIRPLPRFPEINRDLALVLDRSLPHAEVEAVLRASGGELLEGVRLFDAYEGAQVPTGKKSLAYTLRFRVSDRTLTDDEVDRAVAEVVSAVVGRLGAHVRGLNVEG